MFSQRRREKIENSGGGRYIVSISYADRPVLRNLRVQRSESSSALRPHRLVIFIHPLGVLRARSGPSLDPIDQNQALHITVAPIGEVVGEPAGGTGASAA